VQMRDIAFEPAELEVEQGETIVFRFHNRGDLVHDAFVGDARAQEEHAEEMASDDSHAHGDSGVTVKPGQSAELTHHFEDLGTVWIGCHQPAHYDAGMKVRITVTS
jgi:uncharacterized cupredoxin-like copper-binding protein